MLRFGLARACACAGSPQPLHRYTHNATYLSSRNSKRFGIDALTAMRGMATIIIKCPNIADSITEADISKLDVAEGEYVEADAQVATLETDKVDVAVPTKESGVLRKWLVAEGDKVSVGQDLAELETGVAPPAGNKPKAAEPKPQTEPQNRASPEQTKSSSPQPAAAAAKEATTTTGVATGLQSEKTKQQETPAKSASAAGSGNKASFSREESRVKMTRMRMRIAENLKNSQNTAASLTTFNEIDMSAIMSMRKEYKDAVLEKFGVKLGFMGAFVKASSMALKEFPAVNAAIENNDTLVYREYADISVAVATPKGLVTPVVRNAESMSIVEVEQYISMLGKKARENKIAVEDMAGGTFTISNGGVFGSLMGTPIINAPQTAILGMHATKERAVVVNGQVVSRPMMYVALTYDHRVVDGREAVSFLKMVKELIEDPQRMLLNV